MYLILMTRVTENSVSTIEFYRLFLTKSNGLCWDICWKLRKNNKKIYYFYYILMDHTISTKTYYLKKMNYYFTLPTTSKNLLLSTIYICPHCVYENLIFYITNIVLTLLTFQ